jgi:hypothetical protein
VNTCDDSDLSRTALRGTKNRTVQIAAGIVVVFLVGILICALSWKSGPATNPAGQSQSPTEVHSPIQAERHEAKPYTLPVGANPYAQSAIQSKSKEPTPDTAKWISANYSDLVDMDQITQSGQKLGEVIPRMDREPHLKGSVQPFLAPFSSLLPQVLDMMGAPAGRPYAEVERHFPQGAQQPAWAAILRSGTIKVYYDGQDKARVFLLGNDPKESYHRDYGVVRHVLQALLPNTASSRLSVEVFAYKNDYAHQDLSLNPASYSVTSASFPPLQDQIPLDLVGLQEFFDQQVVLEGGHLDPQVGLELFAKKPDQSPGKEPGVSIADLAVAYRAVFHAGDNEAFVSLDPHRDPAKVTVNFGGLLEDTRVGAIVLEADKRFKTITCGLNPSTMSDVRSFVRTQIPSFLTSAERELMMPLSKDGKWTATRFWYYPESVVVDADLGYRLAAIHKAQFTADAERSRDDFQTPQQFEKYKATSLSPAIRQNIDHLNTHYQEYAAVFPELRHLNSVARLFGICVWLQRAKASNVDLDALTSVILPAYTTERERLQLIASSFVTTSNGRDPNAADVASRSKVVSHTQSLTQSVNDVFGGWEGVAEYLCLVNDVATKENTRYEQEAKKLFAANRTYAITTIVKTPKDMEALAEFLSSTVLHDMPAPTALKNTIAGQRTQLQSLEAEIRSIATFLARRVDTTNAQAVAYYNAQVARHDALVTQHEGLRVTLNATIDKYNALGAVPVVTEIGGGIGLRPDSFTVNVDGRSSTVGRLRVMAGQIGTRWTTFGDGSQWVKSWSSGQGSALPSVRIDAKWQRDNRGDAGPKYRSAMGTYWFAPAGKGTQWRDQLTGSDGCSVCRLGDVSANTLNIATFRKGAMDSYVIGKKQSSNRIVFTRSPRKDVSMPQVPPSWYR